MSTLKTGIKGEQSEKVVFENTAASVGSGLMAVYSTPDMLALMEKTASESVAPYLDEGCGTVGTEVDIRHLAATPIGMTVRCETELTEVDGRRLVFVVKAFDDKEQVGEGTHTRFIIDNKKFKARADAKAAG